MIDSSSRPTRGRRGSTGRRRRCRREGFLSLPSLPLTSPRDTQEIMDEQARQDEERAERHAKELEIAAAKREADQKATRARLQQETLDVLSIQVREKAARSMAEKERESMVVAREKDDVARSEKADAKRRSEMKSRNAAYAAELGQQMAIQVNACLR